MTDANEIADRYIAAWNETDPVCCYALVAAAWTSDASYVEPMMQGEGPDQIAARRGSTRGCSWSRVDVAGSGDGTLSFSGAVRDGSMCWRSGEAARE